MIDAIFVVGTGRSGTHFTCRALAGFEQTYDPLDGQENRRILKPITRAGLLHRPYPNAAIAYYWGIKGRQKPGSVFLDQHHPNLFFLQELKSIFANPVFVYPERNLEQVVASMLNHAGVLRWYEVARRARRRIRLTGPVPYPNQFLGLESPQQLDELALHQLCALRVIAHNNRARHLASQHTNLRFVSYHKLVCDQAEAFAEVFSPEELASLGRFEVKEAGKPQSLSKYREMFSDTQLEDIRNLSDRYSRAA